MTASSATAKKQPTPSRPMWYLGPGAMPISATSKKVPAGVTAFCYAGETEWTPIDGKASQGEGGAL